MSKSILLIRIGLILLATGFVVGPAYHLYCIYLSGSETGRYVLSPEPGPPGAPRTFKPIALELDPAMNPMRIVVGMTLHLSGMERVAPVNEYRAALFSGDRPLWQEIFSAGGRADESGVKRTWKSLEVDEIGSAGPYRLVIRERTKPRISVSGLEVAVRRNVTPPRMEVVVPGYIAALTGFLMVGLTIIWPKLRPGRAEREERERVRQAIRETNRLAAGFDDFSRLRIGPVTIGLVVLVAVIGYLLYLSRG